MNLKDLNSSLTSSVWYSFGSSSAPLRSTKSVLVMISAVLLLSLTGFYVPFLCLTFCLNRSTVDKASVKNRPSTSSQLGFASTTPLKHAAAHLVESQTLSGMTVISTGGRAAARTWCKHTRWNLEVKELEIIREVQEREMKETESAAKVQELS